jgi:predicted enzyme related to lactoylglutathione lyase
MTRPLVHLELHTGNLARARAFYSELLEWRFETVDLGGRRYTAIDLGGPVEGGIAECEANPARWLPYVEVEDIHAMTDHARVLGAAVLLEPREGPAGWRSVITEPAGGEVALWQRKR